RKAHSNAANRGTGICCNLPSSNEFLNQCRPKDSDIESFPGIDSSHQYRSHLEVHDDLVARDACELSGEISNAASKSDGAHDLDLGSVHEPAVRRCDSKPQDRGDDRNESTCHVNTSPCVILSALTCPREARDSVALDAGVRRHYRSNHLPMAYATTP